LHLILKKETKRQRFSKEVTAYVEKLPTDIQKMVNKIRSIILNSAMEIEESIKYKIPFYSHKGLFCYINPTNEKVIIGFSHGAEFSNEYNLLVGSGKAVRHVIFKHLKDIKTAVLQHLIFEALIINEILAARSLKSGKVFKKVNRGKYKRNNVLV
jgi:hypothetical protein